MRFADVFRTMFKAGYEGQRFATTNAPFMIGGKDGVHTGLEGHVAMAYAFLRAMGLDGDIGTVTVDLAAPSTTTTTGHTIGAFANVEITLTSSRYPFSSTGDTNRDNAVQLGMAVVPFNADLNRFRLVVTNSTAASYQVTEGTAIKSYSTAELAAGVNLAADFPVNPFSENFKRVNDAVGLKQDYETKQIKKIFHGAEARADMAKAVERM